MLKNISLKIGQNSVAAFVGPSGSGKAAFSPAPPNADSEKMKFGKFPEISQKPLDRQVRID